MEPGNLKRVFSNASLATLFLIFMVVWSAFFFAPDNSFSVTFFDVGQGDSAFVKTESGHKILIDGGEGRAVLEKVAREVPFWDQNIDLVFLSHPHLDHMGGLIHVLENYDVGRVVLTPVPHSTSQYLSFLEEVKDQGIPVTYAKEGTKFEFGEDESIKVVSPDYNDKKELENLSLNNASLVLKVKKDNSSFLFMGDLEKDGQETLVGNGQDIDADVVKVSHHGSVDSFNPNLFKDVHGKMAVISVGENNFDHPSERVINLLKNNGFLVKRTDEDGDIRIDYIDGEIVLEKEKSLKELIYEEYF